MIILHDVVAALARLTCAVAGGAATQETERAGRRLSGYARFSGFVAAGYLIADGNLQRLLMRKNVAFHYIVAPTASANIIFGVSTDGINPVNSGVYFLVSVFRRINTGRFSNSSKALQRKRKRDFTIYRRPFQTNISVCCSALNLAISLSPIDARTFFTAITGLISSSTGMLSAWNSGHAEK